MNRGIIFGATTLLIVVAATLSAQMPTSQSGCSGCGEARVQDAGVRGNLLIIEGILTSEGMECQALRSDNGKLYTLNGHLKEFKVGDRVQVTGEVADLSTCQQGITINVYQVKRA